MSLKLKVGEKSSAASIKDLYKLLATEPYKCALQKEGLC